MAMGKCDLAGVDARALRQLATALYGDDWAAAVARLTSFPLRTVQRVKAACENVGRDRDASRLLSALRDGVLESLAFPKDDAPPVDAKGDDIAAETARWDDALNGYGVVGDLSMFATAVFDAEAANKALVAFEPAQLSLLVDEMMTIESSFWAFLRASTAVMANPETPQIRAEYEIEALMAADALTGVFGINDQGSFEILQPPASAFGDHQEGFEGKGAPMIILPLEPTDDLAHVFPWLSRMFPLAELNYYSAINAGPLDGLLMSGAVIRLSGGGIDPSALEQMAETLAKEWCQMWPGEGRYALYSFDAASGLALTSDHDALGC